MVHAVDNIHYAVTTTTIAIVMSVPLLALRTTTTDTVVVFVPSLLLKETTTTPLSPATTWVR